MRPSGVSYPGGRSPLVPSAPRPPAQGGGGDLVLTPPENKAEKARRDQEEHREQVRYFNWVRGMSDRDPAYLSIAAIGNANAAGQAVGAYRKAEGVRAGYEDVTIDEGRGGFLGAKLELKIPGGHVSAAQREWHRRHRRARLYVEVCYGFEEARAATQWYLGLPPTLICAEGHITDDER